MFFLKILKLNYLILLKKKIVCAPLQYVLGYSVIAYNFALKFC